MKKLVVAACLGFPGVALAHPGHGTTDSGSIQPLVVLFAGLALFGGVVAVWKLVKRTTR